MRKRFHSGSHGGGGSEAAGGARGGSRSAFHGSGRLSRGFVGGYGYGAYRYGL